ncbi:hypothetical protein AMECASPLE_015751 [Ameca splendens]|uniref:Uncharacterized protein n=1 Tax=Ameca splendens TaxID=208324 RepID=A0ABV0YE21_9TELE
MLLQFLKISAQCFEGFLHFLLNIKLTRKLVLDQNFGSEHQLMILMSPCNLNAFHTAGHSLALSFNLSCDWSKCNNSHIQLEPLDLSRTPGLWTLKDKWVGEKQ